MLKKGFAWHYTAYDRRMELSKVTITSTLVLPKMTQRAASFLDWRACSEHFCNHVHEVPDEWTFSVGESGTDESNRIVGIARSWETMGMEEEEAHWGNVNQLWISAARRDMEWRVDVTCAEL